jgi:DNA-damage-inducible protein J
MAKSATNLSLDIEAKQTCIQLFSELGLDLSTAVNMFLKQCIRVHGIPFIISTDEPNAETIAALNEYAMFKQHPEKYKRYASFKDAMNEVLADDT